MTKTIVSLVAIVSSALLLSTPAFATKGIDAARKCEATPHCVVHYYGDGSIIIQIGDNTVACSGPQADCQVIGIRPTSGGTPPKTGTSKR